MADDRIRPHVLMMSEITADGKLTLKKGASSKILMKYMAHETEILLHETTGGLRRDHGRVQHDPDRQLIPDGPVRPGKSPLRVIPSSDASLPPDSNVLKPDAPTVIAVCARAPAERVDAIRASGADVIVAGEERVDLPLLMQRLSRTTGCSA